MSLKNLYLNLDIYKELSHLKALGLVVTSKTSNDEEALKKLCENTTFELESLILFNMEPKTNLNLEKNLIDFIHK